MYEKVPDMKFISKGFILISLTTALLFIWDSCGPLKTAFDVSDLTVEKKLNGYLIHFTANKKIEDVEAFISQSNWLIVTFAGASIDSVRIEAVRPVGIIKKIETEDFGPSVQVALRLEEGFRGKVEVVHDPYSYDIFVNLITTSQER